MTGKIVKAVAGRFYVYSNEKVYECFAKGIFRKKKITLVTGDNVEFELISSENGNIINILPRKNSLIRPLMANLDILVIVVATDKPSPNLVNIDKLTAVAESKSIEPLIIINKTDLADFNELKDIYETAGYKVILMCRDLDSGITELKAILSGKVSAFTGLSGVGKSTLLNKLGLSLKVGQLSEKINRGKHTTIQVELFKTDFGAWVADTPGFSAIETDRYEIILKDQLQFYFKEFEPYLGSCRFSTCSHTGEKGCAIFEALEKGLINPKRYSSYMHMYNEAKSIKEWEL